MRNASAIKAPAGQGAHAGPIRTEIAMTGAEAPRYPAHPVSAGRPRTARLGQGARASVEPGVPVLSGTLTAASGPWGNENVHDALASEWRKARVRSWDSSGDRIPMALARWRGA